MELEAPAAKAPEPVVISVKEFFEKVPPGSCYTIGEDAFRQHPSRGWLLEIPDLRLHCAAPDCDGVRFFTSPGPSPAVQLSKTTQHFTTFICNNCGNSPKTYAYQVTLTGDGQTAKIHKFGELPAFGPPTHSRLISLLGPEREYYLKGRRSENQGLGIAAFAYYRRVLDNQRVRIIEEISRVAERLGAELAMLDDLNAAKAETQFSKAIEAVKHGIPQALFINGRNPLLLLHSALSEGIHAQTDEDCLELAASVRIVLTELVERMASVLKEDAELKSAVSRLLTKGNQSDKER
jgi:hypothetical protein